MNRRLNGEGRPHAMEMWIGLIALVGLFLVAIALIASSFLYAPAIKSWLDHKSNRGDAGLGITQIVGIEHNARFAGIALLVVGLVAAVYLRKILDYASRCRQALSRDAAVLLERSKSGAKEIGWLWWAALLLLMIAGTALRLLYINQPMRTDEAQSYLYFVSKPLIIAITNYAAPNNHLFHTLLCHISVAIFGNVPWAIRLPALMAGIALIPLTFLAGTNWYSPAAGTIAAVLVTACSYLIEYSTNARGYTIQAALVLVNLLMIGHAIRASNWFVAVVAGVASALAFWTIPTTLYPFAAGIIWWAIANCTGSGRSQQEQRIGWAQLGLMVAIAVSLSAFLYSPVFLARGIHAVTANSYVSPLPFGTFIDGLGGEMSGAVKLWLRGSPYTLISALLVLLAGIGLFQTSIDRRVIGFPLVLLLTMLFLLTMQRVLPFQRVWIFAIPFACIAVGAGSCTLSRLFPYGIPIALTLIVLIGGNVVRSEVAHSLVTHSEETGLLPDGPQIADFLADRLKPGDRIVMGAYLDLPISYYLKSKGMYASYFDLSSVSANKETIYLIDRPPVATLDMALAELPGRHGFPAAIARFGQSTVYIISPVPEAPTSAEAGRPRF